MKNNFFIRINRVDELIKHMIITSIFKLQIHRFQVQMANLASESLLKLQAAQESAYQTHDQT